MNYINWLIAKNLVILLYEHTVKILLASLLALSAKYFSDFVSLMSAALIARNSNDYIQSSVVGIANIIISVRLLSNWSRNWE